MKLIKAMKKEFKLMRAFWSLLCDHVAALDELSMCTQRLELAEDLRVDGDESKSPDGKRKKSKRGNDKDFNSAFLISMHEVETQAHQFVSDDFQATADFHRKNGQLSYLENIKASGKATSKNDDNTDQCPICCRKLGVEWSVLQVKLSWTLFGFSGQYSTEQRIAKSLDLLSSAGTATARTVWRS